LHVFRLMFFSANIDLPGTTRLNRSRSGATGETSLKWCGRSEASRCDDWGPLDSPAFAVPLDLGLSAPARRSSRPAEAGTSSRSRIHRGILRGKTITATAIITITRSSSTKHPGSQWPGCFRYCLASNTAGGDGSNRVFDCRSLHRRHQGPTPYPLHAAGGASGSPACDPHQWIMDA
jgi:hypothetical protein